MSVAPPSLSIHIDESSDTATIRLSSRSKAIVCQCLGQQVRGGKRHFYLDRLIHNQEDYLHHCAFGVLSTVIVEK